MSPATIDVIRDAIGTTPQMKSEPSSHCVEVELLSLCARLTVDSMSETRIKALIRQDLDWNFLIISAHRHRVLPLLCRTLERVTPDCVPEDAMRRLRSASHANARRNLCLTGELLRVMDLFRTHDLPCIPYKGPVLAARVYRDISLRQFSDLDIIVHGKDVARARTLLIGRGYRSDEKMSTEKDITLRRADLEIDLEIHWGATTESDPTQVPPELLWKDLCTFSIAGRSVLTHPYENLLLIQCIHGAKHGWERLGWLCDIAEIVRSQPKLNWDRVLDQGTALGGKRVLLVGLTLARELLGAELPPDVVQTMRQEPMLTTLSDQVKAWLFSEFPIPLGERQRFFIRLQEHSPDKFRTALNQAKRYLALNSRDTESFPVPGFLTWVLYPLRIIRLGREYGLTPFTRFLKGIFQS